MRQAITTKFLGPTNFRGSRVKATCQAGSVTISWDHATGSEENHLAAAKALCDKYDWGDPVAAGALPDGTGNCYVLTNEVL